MLIFIVVFLRIYLQKNIYDPLFLNVNIDIVIIRLSCFSPYLVLEKFHLINLAPNRYGIRTKNIPDFIKIYQPIVSSIRFPRFFCDFRRRNHVNDHRPNSRI